MPEATVTQPGPLAADPILPVAGIDAVATRGASAVLSDLVQISKPRILLLLLIVAWSAMFVAAGGLPDWKPFLAVTLAGTFSVAASGAFNHVLERKRDAMMARTATRPVASGRLSVGAALTYATAMAVLSVVVLWFPGYRLAAGLNLAATFYYVVIYTVVLKPTTPQNIVIGGVAGSFPALIGWAAYTQNLGLPGAWPAFILAALVFLWTPAHFWALALLYKKDYAAADYPMMPNVRGDISTRRQIAFYSALTLVFSVSLVALHQAGWVYLIAALALGAVLVLRSIRLLGDHTPQRYRSFFFYTIQYLGLLLIALMVDRVIRQPPVF